MANKNYLVNEAIQVIYQPSGAKSGQTVTMEIFDETGVKDAVDYPDVTMTEISTTGRYIGTFTPDTQGEWIIMASYGNNKGKVVKQYSVGGYNIDSIGQTVDSIESQTLGIDSPPIIG